MLVPHSWKLCLVNWTLRSPICKNYEFPRLEATFPSLDISFMSENCDRKGCNLGIRLNINFSNKTLLFCLMVRQKNVYNLYMCFVSTKCTCKKCCAKKWQLFCSMERHQKRGTRRKQENKKTRVAHWTDTKIMFQKTLWIQCWVYLLTFAVNLVFWRL